MGSDLQASVANKSKVIVCKSIKNQREYALAVYAKLFQKNHN